MRREKNGAPAEAADTLAHHAQLTTIDYRVGDQRVPVASKLGVRGYPDLDGALTALAEAWRRGRLPPLAGEVLDLTATPGALPLIAAELAPEAHWTLAISSAATLIAARATLAGAPTANVRLVAALPWEVAGRFDRILWRPPADRGLARVRAELAALVPRLKPDGELILMQHKDEGAERSEREAAALFTSQETFERHRGWRLSRLALPRPQAAAEPTITTRFTTPIGELAGMVGVFAGEKLDAGSALLLRLLEAEPTPARVLDLGCGTGVLARAASAWGASEVLALDDDLAAVRATAANLSGFPGARTLHADLLTPVEGALGPLGFDAVWCNPPFHVGRQVEEGLSAAFVAAAMLALRPGGSLTLVANRALRYEARLAPWGRVSDLTPTGEGRYRLLRATRER